MAASSMTFVVRKLLFRRSGTERCSVFRKRCPVFSVHVQENHVQIRPERGVQDLGENHWSFCSCSCSYLCVHVHVQSDLVQCFVQCFVQARFQSIVLFNVVFICFVLFNVLFRKLVFVQ